MVNRIPRLRWFIVSSSCPHKMPQTGCLEPQEFIVSWFWRWEGQNWAISRVGFLWGLSPRLADGRLLSVLTWSLLFVHTGVSLCIQITYSCSVTQLCLTACDPMDCSMPGSLVLHHLLEFAQTHVHWASDAIQPSLLLSSPSPAFSLSQHQGLFQWVSSSHQVAKVLEFQLQCQSFQSIFRVDYLFL